MNLVILYFRMLIYCPSQQITAMQPVLIDVNPLRSPRARWQALIITDTFTIDDVTTWIQARLIFHQWRDDSEKREKNKVKDS